MRRLALIAIVLTACLAGCSNSNPFTDAPKALDKMTPEELCAFYGKYRDNPDLSASGKAIATNQMKAKHCPNA